MGLKNEVTNKQTDSKLLPPGADHSWLVLCPYMASLSKLLLESAVLVVEWMKKLEKNKTIKIVTIERHPLRLLSDIFPFKTDSASQFLAELHARASHMRAKPHN